MNTSILPHPDAPEGQVASLPFYRPSDFPPGSAVLCRLTAPLISHAYGLLRALVPCRILGKDIGAGLVSIIKKQRALDLIDLQAKLAYSALREAERCNVEGRNPERIADQYAALSVFIEAVKAKGQCSVVAVIDAIEALFSDDAAGSAVTLSTIHRAKGMEFPTVFLLDRHLIPSKYATRPEQLTQERNLLYVAVTRAQASFFYIRSDCWKTL